MKLYLFDFDGTLTRKDTLFEFIKFARGSFVFYSGFLATLPVLVLSKFKIISTQRAKEYFLNFFFAGYSRSRLEELGEAFLEKKLNDLIKDSARNYLKEIKAQGHDICIVSASLDFWLAPFCRHHGFELICTEAQYTDEVFSGRFLNGNCKGKEKEKQIRSRFDLSKYKEIYAFGDTSGDREMLALAHKKFYRNFK